MPDDDSRAIRQVYAGAIERDPEEREEYLDRVCAGRPDLRARVAGLLEVHARDFGERSLPQSADPPRRPSDAGTVAVAIEGRKIGAYVIRRELGRGGMGVVYLADDTRLARAVAIKALDPGLSHSPSLRERLVNEAKMAAGLSHPGIATVYALEEIDGEFYLACEYVPGQPLRALLRSGPLPLDEVVDIGVQLSKALVEAHTKGIVHRDIKPENVIRTPSGVVKILDFGLAREEHSQQARLTQTGVVVGTPAYLAPEQALGRPTDFRTDIFALGLLLYELVSGTNPFVAPSVTATIARIVEQDPPPLSKIQQPCVPALDHIVRKCLRKDPLERYHSTREIVVDLECLQSSLAAHRPAASTIRPADALSGREMKPRPWLAIHQAVLSVVYVSMLYPAWYARGWLSRPWAVLFLLSVLTASAAATSLRLHLWFTAVTFPHQVAAQQASTARWTRVCDVVLAVALVAIALVTADSHAEFAMLFVGVSVAILVASFVIEPATVRATLGEPGAGR